MVKELVPLNKKLLNNLSFPVFLKTGDDFSEILDISKNKDFISVFLSDDDDNNPFYIRKKDLFLLVRDFKEKIQTAIPEEKIKLISLAGDLINSNIVAQNFSEDSISSGFNLVLDTVNGDKEFLFKSINILSKNNDIGSKTFLRSIICLLIAQALDWKMTKNYQNLIISSLLADMGDVLSPNECHPQNSINYLGEFKKNQDIYQIIMHHHENLDGSGPLGLTRYKIHPLGKILRVADEIVIQSQSKTLSDGIFVCLSFNKNLIDKDPIDRLLLYLKSQKKKN